MSNEQLNRGPLVICREELVFVMTGDSDEVRSTTLHSDLVCLDNVGCKFLDAEIV